MRHKIAVFLQITLLLLMVCIPAGALADSGDITLVLNKTTVATGESVTASGITDPDAWIVIKVINGAGSIIVFDAQKADGEGNYSIDFNVPDAEGTLTVVAGEGSNVATRTLTIKSDSSGGGGGGSGGSSDPVNSDNEEEKQEELNLTDIAGHWAEDNIKELVALGAVNGYPDGTFRPNDIITRAEFAVILVKALKLEPQNGKVFADTAGHWAEEAVATAEYYGIVSGYNANTFGVKDPITREQMAAMMVRAVKLTPVTEELTFIDNDKISDWASEAVAAAVNNGIINGYPDKTLRPQGNATRAEAVTVINNAL